MAPRFSASGSFAGVYGVSSVVGSVIDETANYTGAVMVFQQTSAPTGWTKSTTDNDAILTATTGSLTTGGSLGFTSAFNATRTASGALSLGSFTVGTSSVTAGMIPSHTHTVLSYDITANPLRGPTGPASNPTMSVPTTSPITGSGSFPVAYTGPTSHNHPSPSAGLNTNSTTYFSRSFDLKYVDVIIATKN